MSRITSNRPDSSTPTSTTTTVLEETPDPTKSVGACSTLIDLVRWRGRYQPEQIAYSFLLNGEEQEAHLTYGDLEARARALAVLISESAENGQRVLLLYPPGFDYIVAFYACLFAAVIPVGMNPAELRTPVSAPALNSLVGDAEISLVLSNALIYAKTTAIREMLPRSLGALRWLLTDDLDLTRADAWKVPRASQESVAYLQYTSGSTGNPKGVVLTHGNLLHNASLIVAAFDITSGGVGVIWLPPYHDMGLVGGLIVPLFAGIRVVLLSPIEFLQRPYRWLSAITRYGASFSGGPNFAYDLCARKITESQRASLDLRSWRVAFTGAEPVRAQTLEAFSRLFASSGFRSEAFYPCYGLAEATLFVTGGDSASGYRTRSLEREPIERHGLVKDVERDLNRGGLTLTGCGRAWGGQTVVIVDPERRTSCAANTIGEIWVAGKSVAAGYWRRPAETRDTFDAYLADTGEGPFLRTGDLGFLDGNQLFITGRLKDLIIVRGRNLYPDDIEHTVVESCFGSRADLTVAFGVDVDGEERVVIQQGIERRVLRELQPNERIEQIREAVTLRHGVSPYAVLLVRAAGIPKTVSGKIRRGECRLRFLAGAIDPIGYWQSP
jgi:acyl-CoA synthetase (AMP-forming)/AMP-acid ligase II